MSTFHKELPDEAVKAGQLDSVKVVFKRSGAKAAAMVAGCAAPALCLFDTGDSSQAAVDTLLGTASDITYATSFGSTALGTDAIGVVVKCQAAKSLVYAKVTDYQSAGGSPALAVVYITGNLQSTTALADTLSNKAAVTAAGNLYLQCVPNSNTDDATAGFIEVEFFYIPK